MNQHVSQKRALFLASLSETEPAKRKALSHAEGCTSCARLIHESEQLLFMIDHSGQPAAPVVDAQLAERVKEAVFGAPQVQLAAAEPWHVRFWPQLAWLVGGALSALMIWFDVEPNASLGHGNGVDCVLFENAYALATCVAAAIWARTSKRAIDPWTGSVVGMSGALLGQLLLRTHCTASHAAVHLLTLHVLGILIGTALGALATPMLTRTR